MDPTAFNEIREAKIRIVHMKYWSGDEAITACRCPQKMKFQVRTVPKGFAMERPRCPRHLHVVQNIGILFDGATLPHSQRDLAVGFHAVLSVGFHAEFVSDTILFSRYPLGCPTELLQER